MPALALGIGSVASGIIGGISASKAAKQSAAGYKKAMDAANAQQQQSYGQIRTDENPFLTAGTDAINTLDKGLAPGGDLNFHFGDADLPKDDGYNFRLNEGLQALQRSAAARGGLQTGGTLKDINNYAQDAASQEYQNAFNRALQTHTTNVGDLTSLAGFGSHANDVLANAGENEANQIGHNDFTGYTGQADAQAAGTLGVGNAASGAVNGLVSSYLYSKGAKTPTGAGKIGVTG